MEQIEPKYVWGLKKEIESDNTASMCQGSLNDLKKIFVLSLDQEKEIGVLDINETIDIVTVTIDPQSNLRQVNNVVQIVRLS